jgi:hypothetical protein
MHAHTHTHTHTHTLTHLDGVCSAELALLAAFDKENVCVCGTPEHHNRHSLTLYSLLSNSITVTLGGVMVPFAVRCVRPDDACCCNARNLRHFDSATTV